MSTKLIQFQDGILVEVASTEDEAHQVAGGVVDKINSTFDKINPLLIKICAPIASAWKEMNKNLQVEQAEVELGLSFEGEGNLYITKSKVEANLTVKLILKSPETTH